MNLWGANDPGAADQLTEHNTSAEGFNQEQRFIYRSRQPAPVRFQTEPDL